MFQFQTWWDVNQQIIRKVIDGLSGLASGWLIAQGEWGAAIAPVVVLAANFLWFWLANRNKMTVQGLKDSDLPGTTTAAMNIEKIIKKEEIKQEEKV